MAAHHGNEGDVQVGVNSISEIQSWSLDLEPTELAPKMSMGDTEETYIASGALRGSGSIECLWDETDTNGQGSLTPGATVTLNLYPEGSGAGATFFTGDVAVGAVNRQGAKEGLIPITFAYQGVLTETTV